MIRTLSRTHPPAILHDVFSPFSSFIHRVHSSKSEHMWFSDSVRRISIFCGEGIRSKRRTAAGLYKLRLSRAVLVNNFDLNVNM